MKIYKELKDLEFFKWLDEAHNLADTDMKPEYLDELSIDDIHRTVCNAMVFRWFREKHNLKFWIQEHTSDTFIYEIRPHVLSDYKQGETYVYTNYEKVELACLKKLIEIVKENEKQI